MATIDNYKIKITVDGQENVQQLTTNAENADKAFNELGSTIDKVGKITAGAFALIAGSALRMADQLSDIADATGLSVGTVGALAESIEQAGGKFDDVGKVVNTFYKNLEEGANNQTSKAAESLRKLGIGLTELKTLSEQQLLSKALEQLAKMEAGAARTALGMELFGKAFAGIDPARLQQIFATKDIDALNQELQASADFINAMEYNFRTLQKAALSALTPLVGEIKDFRLSAEQANTIIKTLGGILLTIYGAKTIAGIVSFIKLMKDLNIVLKAQALLQAAIAALSGPAGWARAAAAIGLVAGAAYGLNKLLEDNNEQVKDLNKEVEKTNGAFAEATGYTEEQLKKREQEVKVAKEATRQMQQRNAEANKYQRIINDTIGKTEQEADLIRSMADLERQAANEKLNIQKQLDAEIAKGNETNALVVIELKRQLEEVDKQLVIQKELKKEEISRLEVEKQRTAIIEYNIAKVKQGYDEAKAANEQFYQAIVNQGGLTEKEAKRRIEIENAVIDKKNKLYALDAQLAKETDQIKKSILEKQYKDLEESEIKRINDIKNRYALEDELEKSKVAGIVAGLAQISKEFTPYQQAQDAVLATWSKIGSAVDTFVETGKFKFSDFARSVIADLTKMIVKALIFKAIQTALGSFGIPLPGLATGGPAKAGQPYIVGEKGPELFVPKNAGTVIPNNKISAAGEAMATGSGAVSAPVTNNYITNNINAVDAQSVAQLFANNRKTLLGSVKMAEKELPYMA